MLRGILASRRIAAKFCRISVSARGGLISGLVGSRGTNRSASGYGGLSVGHPDFSWSGTATSWLDIVDRPQAIIDFVRETFPKGQCVGFDPYLPEGAGGQMAERIRLYSFYLFDYSYRRMSPSQWMRGCDGPLFTYDRKPFRGGEEVALVGRELDTGLFVWVKGDDFLTTPSPAVVGRGGVSWRSRSGSTDGCLVVGCFGMPAAELKRFSQVRVVGGGSSVYGWEGWLSVLRALRSTGEGRLSAAT